MAVMTIDWTPTHNLVLFRFGKFFVGFQSAGEFVRALSEVLHEVSGEPVEGGAFATSSQKMYDVAHSHFTGHVNGQYDCGYIIDQLAKLLDAHRPAVAA
jgi:hypothetical protein